MTKKNEMTVSMGTDLSTETEQYDWGTNESSAADIVIPRLNLMQQMSKLVIADKAKLGDLVDSVTGEVLGNKDKGIQVIPFHMEKFFVVQKEVKQGNKVKYEYDHVEKITAANENADWEYTHEGVKFKRMYTRNFYVLVPGKVLPYVVSFQSTSAKAGKELATEMYTKNVMLNKAPAASKIELGCRIETTDDGTYGVKTVKVVGDSSREEIALAFKWFQTVRKEETKVDETEDFS